MNGLEEAQLVVGDALTAAETDLVRRGDLAATLRVLTALNEALDPTTRPRGG